MSYMDKVLKIPPQSLGPGARVVLVYHDSNCPKLKSGGECTCDAEIEVGEPVTDANRGELISKMFPK